jgi:hypothetical protein
VDQETFETYAALVGIVGLFVFTCAVGIAAAVRRR